MSKSDKKIVHYEVNNPMYPPSIAIGYKALVKPVDHPDSDRVSNTKYIVTSRVLSYDRTTGQFETMNSIYEPI